MSDSQAVTPLDLTGTINKDQVNYRIDSTTIGNMPSGQLAHNAQVHVIGKRTTSGSPADWYQIDLNGQHFWIATQFVDIATTTAAATTNPVAAAVSDPASNVATTTAASAPTEGTATSSVAPGAVTVAATTILLNAPWYTQMEGGSGHNICGETSVKVMLGYYGKDSGLTPHQLADVLKMYGAETTYNQLISLARQYGIELNVLRPGNSTNDLRTALAASKPIITLVHYQDLGFPDHYGSLKSNWGHWLVVIGCNDDGFFVNDSLWTQDMNDGKGGAGLFVPNTKMDKAAKRGTQYFTGLY